MAALTKLVATSQITFGSDYPYFPLSQIETIRKMGLPPADLAASPGPDGLTELVPDDLTATLHRLTGWALEQHVELTGLEVIRPSLEDVYLTLTDGAAAPAAQPVGAAPARRRGWRRS